MSKRRQRAATFALIGIWAGGALALVSLAAWIASAVWTIFFMSQFGDSVALRTGQISYLWTSDATRAELSARTGMPLEPQWNFYSSRRAIPMEWGGGFSKSGGRFDVWVPLWPLPLIGAGLASVCWFQRRRLTRIGCCERCGYPLAGLPSGAACPECGGMAGSGATGGVPIPAPPHES